MDERLKKQLDFALEIDKEKNIFRQTHLSGHGRNENDAEHAWHMALMAYLLKEYSNEPVDIAKVMLMCLIHDIVEIDAGDTYAYDAEGLKTQKEREDKAKERIFSLLPEDQKEELIALFDEFEAYETPESKYAHAMDNLQPLILNNSNGGSEWVEHAVTAEQIYGRQSKTSLGSKKLYQEVTDKVIQEHIKKGNIKEWAEALNTRGGISALTHAMAVSFAGKVRVNSISPGWINTTNDAIVGVDATQQPVGKVGKPEDIAEMEFSRDLIF